MKNAEMNVVRFDANDVIATSMLGFTASSLGDNNKANNTLTYLGTSYVQSSGNINDFYTAFNSNNGTNIDDSTIFTGTYTNGSTATKTLGVVFGSTGSSNYTDSASGSTLNGTYSWNGKTFTYVKQ